MPNDLPRSISAARRRYLPYIKGSMEIKPREPITRSPGYPSNLIPLPEPIGRQPPNFGGLIPLPKIERSPTPWFDKRKLLPDIGQPVSRGPFDPQRAQAIQNAMSKLQSPARRRLIELAKSRKYQVHQ